VAKKPTQKVECFAYLPPIQSAIMVDGSGDTLQVKFNVALKQSPSALYLQTMTQKKLKLTVEVVEDAPRETKSKNEQTAQKQRTQRYPYRPQP
jgi:plasmid rolling circle replication initiator protein Rep